MQTLDNICKTYLLVRHLENSVCCSAVALFVFPQCIAKYQIKMAAERNRVLVRTVMFPW